MGAPPRYGSVVGAASIRAVPRGGDIVWRVVPAGEISGSCRPVPGAQVAAPGTAQGACQPIVVQWYGVALIVTRVAASGGTTGPRPYRSDSAE